MERMTYETAVRTYREALRADRDDRLRAEGEIDLVGALIDISVGFGRELGLAQIRGDGLIHRTIFIITPPTMIRSLSVLILTCALAACRGSSTTVSNQPRATDRYARLLRRQLTDSDPLAVEGEIACEVGRIASAFGADESTRRLRPVRDSVIRNARDRQRYYEIDSMRAFHTFEIGGQFCDSLNAIANREVPLKPISTSMDSLHR